MTIDCIKVGQGWDVPITNRLLCSHWSFGSLMSEPCWRSVISALLFHDHHHWYTGINVFVFQHQPTKECSWLHNAMSRKKVRIWFWCTLQFSAPNRLVAKHFWAPSSTWTPHKSQTKYHNMLLQSVFYHQRLPNFAIGYSGLCFLFRSGKLKS